MSLSRDRLGELMPIESADNLFSELYEQIMALEKYDANANMNHEMMMARVKNISHQSNMTLSLQT